MFGDVWNGEYSTQRWGILTSACRYFTLFQDTIFHKWASVKMTLKFHFLWSTLFWLEESVSAVYSDWLRGKSEANSCSWSVKTTSGITPSKSVLQDENPNKAALLLGRVVPVPAAPRCPAPPLFMLFDCDYERGTEKLQGRTLPCY